jgi:amino acid permease
MKTCAGTGTLALPWAAQEGGLLLNTVGLYCIALWNCYSVHRLLRTLELYVVYEKSSPPATASTTFSKVVWFVLGPRGIHGLDLVLVVLFVGIIVAYEGMIFTRERP